MNSQTKGHIAAITANLIFGANYSIVKHITPRVIQPFGLNVVRVLVTVFLFWLLWFFNPKPIKVSRKDWGLFVICAAFGIAINQMLFVKGLSLTTSIHASLLGLATPVFITIIAAVILKERLGIYKVAGLLSGIAGAAFLILQKESTGSGEAVFIGNLFIVMNAISYAIFLVISRPLMTRYSPLWVLRIIFTFGTFMILPFGWEQFIAVDWPVLDTSEWLAIAFSAILSTFAAYLLNLFSLKYITSSANGTYIYTQPVFAALVAIFFLGEQLTVAKIFAAILIFTGVYLVNKKKSETPQGNKKVA